jgi:hypothetical protein
MPVTQSIGGLGGLQSRSGDYGLQHLFCPYRESNHGFPDAKPPSRLPTEINPNLCSYCVIQIVIWLVLIVIMKLDSPCRGRCEVLRSLYNKRWDDSAIKSISATEIYHYHPNPERSKQVT